jgi:SAM-dependent methyltransferase
MEISAAEPGVWNAIRHWWSRERQSSGRARALWRLGSVFWEFIRESAPERRRRRYGDAEYDWEQHVNTTSGGVAARSRLLGLLHSEYQPIEPELFREIMARMEIDFDQFTFVDIGSGKGRALLLAAERPFRRIIGIELLPELHPIASENAKRLSRHVIELNCGDAAQFSFPSEPLVVFLFNPLPGAGVRSVVRNIETSLQQSPRPVYLIYVNPEHEQVVCALSRLRKFSGTHQYSLFANDQPIG